MLFIRIWVFNESVVGRKLKIANLSLNSKTKYLEYKLEFNTLTNPIL